MTRSSGATRKRPRFLSLRSRLSPPDDDDSPVVPSTRLRPLRHYYTRRNRRCSDKHQLPKLSLLHPPCSSLAVESCQAIDDHAALLFSSSDDASATLKDLLNCRDEETCTTVVGTSGEESVSLRCAYGGSGPQLRSAMKSGYGSRGGCEDHEEKWVRFSEVVEKKDEEVSSNYRTAVAAAASAAGGLLSLSLKLDYQEIQDAWSDRGSLFICRRIGTEESPQTVPDLCPEFDSFGRGITEWLTGGGNLWTVPEKGEIGDGIVGSDDKEGKMRQREASVLRYKEKRHNRLFAKRIRYEVRKLNAEKRPRIKGRFVRRNGEE